MTCRGGRDQFQWSDVAASKDRESYLGHSLLAPVGRWQKGKDLNWYGKSAGAGGGSGLSAAQQAEIDRERAAIKQAEEDRRMEALGLKKRVVRPVGTGAADLDESETKQLFGSASSASTNAPSATSGVENADRVGGLGFTGGATSHGTAGMELTLGESMAGSEGGGVREQAHIATAGGAPSAASAASLAGSPAPSATRSMSDSEHHAILAEAEAILAKQTRKAEKKEAKREKKEAKREKKSKKESRSRSRSRSPERSRHSRSHRSRSRSRDRSDRGDRKSRDDKKPRDRDVASPALPSDDRKDDSRRRHRSSRSRSRSR